MIAFLHVCPLCYDGGDEVQILDVLWLFVVVALSVGWWLEHRAWAAKNRYTIKEVRNVLPNSSAKTCLELTDRKTGIKQYMQPPDDYPSISASP